jgi:PmbA protein
MEILEFCVQRLQAAEVDKFELCWEKSSSLEIEFNDGKLDHMSRATDQGLAIRTLKNQKLGFAYTFDLSKGAVEKAVRTALEVGELMPADPLNDLCAAGNGGGFSSVLYPEVENYDTSGLESPVEKKIEIARRLEIDAKSQDPRIKRVRNSAFGEVSGESVMVDHHGEKIHHKLTLFSASLSAVAEEGADAEIGSDARYVNYLDQLQPGEISIHAAKNALELLHATQAPTMTCPAVLKNSIVAELVGFLAASFSAENVDKNFSMLAGKKGERLFSDRITLIDDGLMPGGTGSSPFDGEGEPSRTTTLVDHGLVMNYLYDSYYARKHGTKTTANSRRGGLKSPPSVGSTNIYLAKGAHSFDRLVGLVDRGVYVTEVMGLHTANPVTGDFSIGASGILIEKGKLTKPIKGFAIAGNLIELLKNISEVGTDLRFWGGVGAPAVLVSKIAVSGS